MKKVSKSLTILASMKSKFYDNFVTYFFRNFINFNGDQRCPTYGNFHQSLSDRKVRLHTSESVESNNSGQFNYYRNHPLTGMNLNNQFASNGNNSGNVLYYFDEE
jgi:hypothetical protein